MTDNPAEHRPARDWRVSYPAMPGPMESTHFSRSEPAALADLQKHWGDAYVIGLDGDIWSATFRGSADELRAHTCLELRTLIRADYSLRQRTGQARRQPGPADTCPADTCPAGTCEEAADQRPGPPDQPIIRGERMSL
jgi:hypothetical protein